MAKTIAKPKTKLKSKVAPKAAAKTPVKAAVKKVVKLAAGIPVKTAAKTPRKLSIVASKGSLDMAYPPLIIANAARMSGVEVNMFFHLLGSGYDHQEENE